MGDEIKQDEYNRRERIFEETIFKEEFLQQLFKLEMTQEDGKETERIITNFVEIFTAKDGDFSKGINTNALLVASIKMVIIATKISGIVNIDRK